VALHPTAVGQEASLVDLVDLAEGEATATLLASLGGRLDRLPNGAYIIMKNDYRQDDDFRRHRNILASTF
jgi:hypothetical protein